MIQSCTNPIRPFLRLVIGCPQQVYALHGDASLNTVSDARCHSNLYLPLIRHFLTGWRHPVHSFNDPYHAVSWRLWPWSSWYNSSSLQVSTHIPALRHVCVNFHFFVAWKECQEHLCLIRFFVMTFDIIPFQNALDLLRRKAHQYCSLRSSSNLCFSHYTLSSVVTDYDHLLLLFLCIRCASWSPCEH